MRCVIAAVSSPSRSRSRLSELSRILPHSASGHSSPNASSTGAIATLTAWIKAMRVVIPGSLQRLWLGARIKPRSADASSLGAASAEFAALSAAARRAARSPRPSRRAGLPAIAGYSAAGRANTAGKNEFCRAAARARRTRSREAAYSSSAARSAAATEPWVGTTHAVGQRVTPFVRMNSATAASPPRSANIRPDFLPVIAPAILCPIRRPNRCVQDGLFSCAIWRPAMTDVAVDSSGSNRLRSSPMPAVGRRTHRSE